METEKKKVLVVVDVQKDFYHPDGALYVKGAEVLPERIAKVIPQFDEVVFTVDYHPHNHTSFKEQGGPWPMHCVRYTDGATLPKEFIPFIEEYNVITKGELYRYEEYGANPQKLVKSYLFSSKYEMVFCGVAGDYCVKETINNVLIGKQARNFFESSLFDFYPETVKVWLDGTASIDDGTTIREFMKENNIEEWKPQE